MIGSTLTTANAVLCVLTMASSLLSAKGDCQADLASDAFLAFQEAPDNNSTSLAEKAVLCETNISVDFDLDMFAVKGIVLCENNALFDEDFYPLCLPASCTANEDFLDDYLLNMIVSQESNDSSANNDYDVNQCIQNFKYDYIGDGFDPPSYFMCTADYNTGADGVAGPDLAAFESAARADEDLDLAELQTMCDKVDGFDYFTWSGTKYCSDANSDSSTNVEDHPGCLPLSCTSDEMVLLMMVGSPYDAGCDISALTFEGLGDSEPGTGSGTGGGSGDSEDETGSGDEGNGDEGNGDEGNGESGATSIHLNTVAIMITLLGSVLAVVPQAI